MKLRAVCLLSRVGEAFHAEGTGYSKVDYLAKGRMTPRRNWRKAPEAEGQRGEAGGSRPGKNVGLYLTRNRKPFAVI